MTLGHLEAALQEVVTQQSLDTASGEVPPDQAQVVTVEVVAEPAAEPVQTVPNVSTVAAGEDTTSEVTVEAEPRVDPVSTSVAEPVATSAGDLPVDSSGQVILELFSIQSYTMTI